MTPFGERVRQLRRERGISQQAMAEALGVSAGYLSALEHGRRSPPNWAMVQKVIGFFNVIWDEAEELERLARVSHPRVAVDTAGLSPRATALANRLAETVGELDETALERLTEQLETALRGSRRRARRRS
ncbi:helix-turn-helix domain-containing protein [Aquibium sp. A9E412]|uniref:helix-turn-helix domain-containing protein n=1 Tax=Aquibium sp. A9E412 TaxID=2976767 RepID=UPI0025B177BD|nr:helix-turn-helix transcriptional regulator [Aquibium sp. A9E412]MDN2566413.1 helix-turn-helix domain-containing protein [Aquibium sp. A9E412]